MAGKTITITPSTGRAIRGRREAKGLTLAAAAARAGSPSVAVWNSIELGKQSRANPSTLRGICRALDWAQDLEALARGEVPDELPSADGDGASVDQSSHTDGWLWPSATRFERYEETQRRIMHIQEIQAQRLELLAAELTDLRRRLPQ